MEATERRTLALAGWALIWLAVVAAFGLIAAGAIHAELARPGVQVFVGAGKPLGALFNGMITLHGALLSSVPVIVLVSVSLLLIFRNHRRQEAMYWSCGVLILLSGCVFAALASWPLWRAALGLDDWHLVQLWDPVLAISTTVLLSVVAGLIPVGSRFGRWFRLVVVAFCAALIGFVVWAGAFNLSPDNVPAAQSLLPGDSVSVGVYERYEAVLYAHVGNVLLGLAVLALHFCAERWVRDPAWVYGVLAMVLLQVHGMTSKPIHFPGAGIFGTQYEDTQMALLTPHAMGGMMIAFSAYVVAFRWIEAAGYRVTKTVTWLHASVLAVVLFLSIATFAILGSFGMPRRYMDYPESYAGWNLAGAALSGVMIALHICGLWRFYRIVRATNSATAPS